MSHKPDRDFLYILKRTDTGNYVYVDSTGAIAYTASPTALVRTPEGWQKKSIMWERDIVKSWGLGRTFTVPLEYVEDGAVIISTLALASFETPLQLIIQQLGLVINGTIPQTHDWVYVDLYIGEPDLSKVEGSEERIKAPMIEGGLAQQVKANEDTVYEFVFDDYKTVKMDGSIFKNVGNFFNPGVTGITFRTYILPVSFLNKDGTAGADVVLTTSQIEQLPNGIVADVDFSTRTNWFLQTLSARSVRIKGSIGFDMGGSVHNLLFFIKGTSNTIYFSNIGGHTGPSTISFDFTAALPAGEGLFMYVGVLSGVTVNYLDTDIQVFFDYKFRTTSIRGFTPYVLFQKLVEKMTGTAANAESTLLQSFSNIIISCGDAVRGIAGAKLKTSFNQFIQFCRTQFVAGYEISAGKIKVKTIEDLCSVSSPVSLGECKNFKWNFATDLMFNSIEIGYPQKDTDDVNGKFAFNNTQLWTISGIRKVPGKLSLICPYVSDPFYIELNRANLEGKTTTDDSIDSVVILLNTQPIANGTYTASFGIFLSGNIVQLTNGFPNISLFAPGSKFTVTGTTSNNGTFTVLDSFQSGTNDLWIFTVETVTAEGPVSITVAYQTLQLKRVSYINTDTGVPDIATLFNIEFLTPHRMLLRWLKYINSCLFQFAGQNIEFQSTEKNRDLKTDDGTTVIDEDAPIAITTDRFFKAIDLHTISVAPDLLPLTLQTNPNVGFNTIWNSVTWLGILRKGGMAPNTLQEQEFILLAGPATDESLLANT